MSSMPAARPTDYATDSGFTRAAAPVLDRVREEYDGVPLGFVVADHEARIVEVANSAPGVGLAINNAGVECGSRMSEDEVGTNAVGTVLEERRGMLVRGRDHYLTAFQQFTCYGQPVVNPMTRRVEGVLNVGGGTDEDERFFAPVARRMSKDIEDLLVQNSPVAQQRLLSAFHAAARRRGQPLMVLGEGLVLATPAALSLLDPADHATIRAYADDEEAHRRDEARIVLTSGQAVDLSCLPVEGTDGVLVNLTIVGRSRGAAATSDVAFPLLVTGEPGSGRTTEGRRRVGGEAATIDAADIARRSEEGWLRRLDEVAGMDGPALIIENIHLLRASAATVVARLLSSSPRDVVLTATTDNDGPPPALVGICQSRIETAPLRQRRHEIPRLANEILAEFAATSSVRLSVETQRLLAAHPWPGNLAELRRVMESAARARSAGDIIPADLPEAYRNRLAALSPLHMAERDAILGALRAADGNKVRAARALGISRATLYNRMRTLKIG